ncbi:MAG TPA: ATP-binding protein [Nitrososphaeraceae archaeon]|nr:ATP-binding protein [Nitrososphaeraceae archaeon]
MEPKRSESIHRTRVLNNPSQISEQIRHIAENYSGLSIASTFGGMQLIHNTFLDSYKKILGKYKKGEGNGIRWITNIEEECVELVKTFLDLNMQIKHVRNLPPINFAVGKKEVNLTIEKMEGGKMIQSLIASNEPSYVTYFYSIFEQLWSEGVDAQDRIRNIAEGRAEETDIEIIPNPKKGIDNAWKILRSAKKEILIICSTSNAFRRQLQIGGLQLLKGIVEKNNVKVRILVPADAEAKLTIKEISISNPGIDIRSLEEALQTCITIVIVDRKECVIVESKDDTKETSYDAAGISTYSNSKAIATSYVSIFESLWNQTELFEELKKSNSQLANLYKQVIAANEQMKTSSNMQKEFINVAAHELRAPIQPILGLAEVLRQQNQQPDNKDQMYSENYELLNVIIRNAKRLQQLTENILDVTKIENNSMELNKEEFILNKAVLESFTDFANQLSKEQKENVKLIVALDEGDILVVADKHRINQVINNLLNNALKFTKQGQITLSTEKEKKYGKEAIVKIQDSGPGIDPDIMPRLFSKFATKSYSGTGLGLFISKSIVETHGGKMWAENNLDGKGATFLFTLPIAKN